MIKKLTIYSLNYKFQITPFFIAIFIFNCFAGFAQNTINCQSEISKCVPRFKYHSILPDTAYYNCVLSRQLDPHLDKSGTMQYQWTDPYW